MRIFVAKNAGFCFGVRNAVETAFRTEGKVCTLGELIHNGYVNGKLRERGVSVINDADEYDGGTVIIRSHGVPESVENKLKEKGIPYIDATCPFVKKIHNLVAKYHALGYLIVIIGTAAHPEVVGINGRCGESAFIVDCEEDVNALPTDKKLCVVVQTTYSESKYEELIKSIENRCKTVEKFRTICYTTTDRQSETEALSKKCDAMLVIGSKTSSNTTKLFEIARRNCERTYFIESIADLAPVIKNKHNFKILGVTAGASTPKELIEEVVKQMNDTHTTSEFEKLLAASDKKNADIKAGKIFRECKVISANAEGIIISFGGKKDGFIDKADAELDGIEYNPENYKPGDVIAAMVIEKSSKKGNESIAFSKKAVDKRNLEDKEAEEAIRGGEFKVTVARAVKGGLEARLGSYKIFIPASQIKIGYVPQADLEKYVGKTLRLRAIEPKKSEKPEEVKEETAPVEGAVEEVKAEEAAPAEVAEQPKEITVKKGRSIVASQKVILEEEKAKKEDELWSKLTVGSIVTGKVKRLTDFGAFVSVYGFDCLAHIADLSHYSVAHPSEVLEIGKSYEFIILKANREANKVSLGYKQLQKKPYEIAAEKYPVGSVITGKVRSVFPYGIFVLIERDVDGLVPVSELSRSYVKNPADLYKEGDEVTAQVIKFNDNKITLSIKALLPEEEKKADDVEISDEEYQEAKEKRASRNAKKFEKPAGATPRKKVAKKSADEEEATSWQSESTGATLGDLFNLMKFASEEEKEEKPSDDKKDESDGE